MAADMVEDMKSGMIGATMIAGEVVVRMEAADVIGAGVEPLQEGAVALLAVKALQRGELRLSSGIVSVRSVKPLKTSLLVLLLEEMPPLHLEGNLQLMKTNRGPITLVCVASHSFDHFY